MTARRAGTPNGTRRSLSPLPTTRSTFGRQVDVVDVEADELADPHPGGVEQLQGRTVAQVHRVVVVRGHRGHVEQGGGGALGEHRRQRPVAAGRAEPQGGVRGDPAGALEPAEEGAQRRRRAGDGRARGPAARQHAEPGPQVGEGDRAQALVVVRPDLVEEHTRRRARRRARCAATCPVRNAGGARRQAARRRGRRSWAHGVTTGRRWRTTRPTPRDGAQTSRAGRRATTRPGLPGLHTQRRPTATTHRGPRGLAPHAPADEQRHARALTRTAPPGSNGSCATAPPAS